MVYQQSNAKDCEVYNRNVQGFRNTDFMTLFLNDVHCSIKIYFQPPRQPFLFK